MQGITKNIFHLILIAMVTFGGLSVKDLGEKLISMGCDGNSVFGCSFQGILHLGLKMP